ncbi:MBL fold metallo-hydrolase [Jatrophihabitans sp. DSM 45814]
MMSLEGTNTWILRDEPGRRSAVVIDPGPDSDEHRGAVLDAAGSVELILLTHGHIDHSEGARRMHEVTGAPVRALDPAHRYGTEGLGEGDTIEAAGVRIDVWSTPGHTSDSLSFVLPAAQSGAQSPSEAMAEAAAADTPLAVLTGDTILGRGTTVVSYPDGVLEDYLNSLNRLAVLDGVSLLPGHGPELVDAGAVARQYLAHREQRLDQVRQALLNARGNLTPRQVVKRVYADVDKALWPAAELSVRAQLTYLRAHGMPDVGLEGWRRFGLLRRLSERGGPTARGRG